MLAYSLGNMVVATLHQQYKSKYMLMETVKRQDWQQDDVGRAKIIYEGSV